MKLKNDERPIMRFKQIEKNVKFKANQRETLKEKYQRTNQIGNRMKTITLFLLKQKLFEHLNTKHKAVSTQPSLMNGFMRYNWVNDFYRSLCRCPVYVGV